jgi:hypothetical protein
MIAQKKATGTVAKIKEQCKGTKHLSDYQICVNEFAMRPRTMFELEIETGIPRPYICWYVRAMRKRGIIQVAKLGRCPISREGGVMFLTTNPKLFRPDVKCPTLFDV